MTLVASHVVLYMYQLYIRQNTGACVITKLLHFQHSKLHPNLKPTAQLAYIVVGADCDCGKLFNIFIMFSIVSIKYPMLVYSIMTLYSHSYGICGKVCKTVSGKGSHQVHKEPVVSNCACYIRKYCNSDISVNIL